MIYFKDLNDNKKDKNHHITSKSKEISINNQKYQM